MSSQAAKFIIGGLLIVIAVLVIVSTLGLAEFQARTLALLSWVEQSPWIGLLVLGVVLIAFVFLMLPSVLLTVGAGFLFGVWAGSLLVVVSNTIGASLAFVLARYGAPRQLQQHLYHSKYYTMFNRLVARKGWQVVALTRMVPFFSYKLSNYIYGVTNVSGKNYLIGTFLGLWPISVFNVYLGSITSDIVSIGTAKEPSMHSWLFIALVLIALTLALTYFIRKHRMTLIAWAKEQ